MHKSTIVAISAFVGLARFLSSFALRLVSSKSKAAVCSSQVLPATL